MAAGAGVDPEPTAAGVGSARRTRSVLALVGWRRSLVVAVIAGWAAVPLLAALAAGQAGWEPTGDVAIIGLRSRDAWTVHPPLVGQPTTGSSYAGVASYHPGPAEYWLLGPWVRALGPTVGMLVGVAVVNGAALAGTMWVAFRRGGPVLLGLVSLAVAALVRSIGAFALIDPFNSEIATFPLLLTVLAAWSVIVGDRRLVPLLAASATLAAQTHVSGAVAVAPILIGVLVVLVVQARRGRWAPADDPAPLVAGGVILGLGWLPVLIRELTGPSNVSALVRTARAPHPTLGWPFAVERTAGSMGPPPLFTWTPPDLIFLGRVSAPVLLAAAVIAGTTVGLVLVLRGRGRGRGLGVLALLIGAVALTSTWTAATAPPFSAIRSDVTRSTWLVSLLVWLLAAWAAWHLLGPEARRRWSPRVLPICAGLSVVLVGVALAGEHLTSERDGAAMAAVRDVADRTLSDVPPGTYRLQLEGEAAVFTVGPGLALRLDDAGRRIVVPPGPFGDAYGDQRARTVDDASVDGTLRVVTNTDTDAPPAPEPGERVVAEVPLPASTGGSVTVLLGP